MSLLEIVIPTYNRANCIEYILENTFKNNWLDYDVLFSIYDSSPNELTKEVCCRYKNEKIRYIRMDSSVDIDEKTMIIVKNNISKYVMLCGDGILPNIKEIFKNINFNTENNDIITLYSDALESMNRYYKGLEDKIEVNDKDEFFKNYFYQVSLYGGTICNSRIFETMDIPSIVKKYKGTGFIYPCSLVEHSKGPYAVMHGDFITSVPYKGSPGWITNGKAIQIWARNFPNCIETLDGSLSKATIDYIIKKNGTYTGFLTIKGFAWFRATGNFSLKIYKEYKADIKRASECSSFILISIALVPKFVFVGLRKLYKLIKK